MLTEKTSRSSVTVQLAFLLLLAACKPDGGSYAPPIHYSIDQLAGEWIGFPDEEDGELYQVVLHPDGTGALVMAGQHGVSRYAITEWRMATNISLDCLFGLTTNAAAPKEMKCAVKKHSLRAVLSSGKGGWQRHIIFRRAQDLKWLKYDGTA